LGDTELSAGVEAETQKGGGGQRRGAVARPH
jgi:hypothetical protein